MTVKSRDTILVGWIRRTLLREHLIERTPGQILHAAKACQGNYVVALRDMQRELKGGKVPKEIAELIHKEGWYEKD